MKAVIFDTETTGLVENRTRDLSRQPEIIEFYGCLADIDTGEIEMEVNHLIKPSQLPLSEFTEKHTGIKTADVSRAKSFGSVAGEIALLFETAPLGIAHNATFDKDMVEIEFERLGRTVKMPRLLCTVEQTHHIKGHRLTLSDLHEHLFKEPFSGAHRAKIDVAALLRCCVELRRLEMI
jgi:DNA polymerase III epsilon subunit-like protein